MRLMIIGITALGLAALAMIIADGRLFNSLGFASLWGGDVRQVRFANDAWAPRQKRDTIVIPVAHGQWKTMSGFPSYASFVFPLTQHTQIEAGAFVLEFSLQLPSSGGGAMRVMINNEKRAELLFERDRTRYRITVELTDADLKKGELFVALSADGYGAGGECPDDRSRIAIIEIKPNTRVELRLAAPISHPADAAILAGDPIRLLMSDDNMQLHRERTLALALRLEQKGRRVEFVAKDAVRNRISIRIDPKTNKPRFDRRMNEVVMSGPRDAALLRPANVSSSAGPNFGKDDILYVEALGAAVHTRQFRREIKWRIDFDLKDMPDGAAPTQLNLKLFRSALGEDHAGLLSISFNGGLLHSASNIGISNPLSKKITLPQSEMRLENALEISILTNEDRIGICNPGRDAFAQLLKPTALTRFRPPQDMRAESLPHRLRRIGHVQISAPFGMQSSAYRESISLLARITPPTIKLTSSERLVQGPTVRATIIPLQEFRTEIGKYLPPPAAIRAAGGDYRPDQAPIIWVGVDASALGFADPAQQYARLTRASANKILNSDRNGVAIIFELPAIDEIGAS